MKISVFVICVEAIICLSLYNLHDCTFNKINIAGKSVILGKKNQGECESSNNKI